MLHDVTSDTVLENGTLKLIEKLFAFTTKFTKGAKPFFTMKSMKDMKGIRCYMT